MELNALLGIEAVPAKVSRVAPLVGHALKIAVLVSALPALEIGPSL